MKCKICGAELDPGATTCRVCGVVVDYKDYNADPFSSAETRINDMQQPQNTNMLPAQDPVPNNNGGVFFPGTGGSSSSSGNKGTNKIVYIVLIVILVGLLIGGGFFLIKALSPSPKAISGDDKITLGGNKGITDKDLEKEKPEKPVEPEKPADNSVYKDLDGYRFKVLNGYSVEEGVDTLTFINQSEKVQFILAIYPENPYKAYVDGALEVQEQWEARNYLIDGYNERQYGAFNWLIFNSYYNNATLRICYREFFNDNTIEILVLNYGNLSDDQVLNKIESMLVTATIADTYGGVSELT